VKQESRKYVESPENQRLSAFLMSKKTSRNFTLKAVFVTKFVPFISSHLEM